MKFTIDDNARKSLLAILSAANSLASGRIPGFTRILAEDSEISAIIGWFDNNLLIKLPAEVTDNGSINVSTSSLEKVLKSNGEAEFTASESALTVLVGVARSQLPSVEVDVELDGSFDAWVLGEELSGQTNAVIPTKELLEMVSASAPAMSKDLYRPQFAAMLFEAEEGYLKTVATNGHMLSVYRRIANVSLGEQAVMTISANGARGLQKALKAICKKGFVGSCETSKITIGKEGVRVQCGTIIFSGKAHEAYKDGNRVALGFPTHYPQIIPPFSERDYVRGLNVGDIVGSISSLKPIFSEEKDPHVRVEVCESGSINLSVKNSLGGEASVSVQGVDYHKNLPAEDGEGTRVTNLDPALLSALLSGLDKKSRTVSFGVGARKNDAALITSYHGDTDEGLVSVIMPMRV